ncbi:hypothetical protein O3S80_25235 [Streptomyces sp. Lzd4kr]|nr:hypothetical protein [Streptomyces sp. Lzd4kr]
MAGGENTTRWTRKLAVFAVGWSMLMLAGNASPASARQAVAVEDARYIFEIDRVESIDETGWASAGSDEIHAKIVVNNCGSDAPCPLAHGTMYTDVLDDLDEGETDFFDYYGRTVAPKLVVSDKNDGVLDGRNGERWQVSRAGVKAPFGMTVTLYEDDDLIQSRMFNWSATALFLQMPVPLSEKPEFGTTKQTFTFTGAGGEFKVTFYIIRVS